MLVLEKGKIVKSDGIELPDGKVIKSLQKVDSYKYSQTCVKGPLRKEVFVVVIDRPVYNGQNC